VVGFNLVNAIPGPWASVSGLLVLGLIPTWLGFKISEKILNFGSTVLKFGLLNFFGYFFYSAFLVGLCWLIPKLGLPIGPEYQSLALYIFILVCLALSWTIGVYFLLQPPVSSQLSRSLGIKVFEVSSALVIPAVYLLISIGLSNLTLTIIITCWFIALALTLALEASNSMQIKPRYDIVAFHALVPYVVAIFLFVVLFSGEAHQLMESALKLISAAVLAIFEFLDSHLKLVTHSQPTNFEPGNIPGTSDSVPMAREISPWFFLPIWLFGGFLMVFIVKGLVQFLKSGLSLKTLPTQPFNPYNSRQYSVWKMFILWWNKISTRCRLALRSIHHKFKACFFKNPTPYYRVFRSYQNLLKTGQKYGFAKNPSETPLEYGLRITWAETNPLFPKAEILALTHLFLKAHYSRQGVNHGDAETSEGLLRTINSRLKEVKG
jgi:hypothetical protein